MSTIAIILGAIFLALLIIGILAFIGGCIQELNLGLPSALILIGAIGFYLCLVI